MSRRYHFTVFLSLLLAITFVGCGKKGHRATSSAGINSNSNTSTSDSQTSNSFPNFPGSSSSSPSSSSSSSPSSSSNTNTGSNTDSSSSSSNTSSSSSSTTSSSSSTASGSSTSSSSGSVYDGGEILDFGGMYGGYWNATLHLSLPYNNPITNAPTCPPGYSASQALGTVNLDYPIVYCYRPHQYGREPEYDFGGAFGYTTNNVPYVNPATGHDSCPSGYSASPVLGTPNLDWAVFFCYREHKSHESSATKFGGMFGFGLIDNSLHTYVNVVTNGATCPRGYHPSTIVGTPNVDFSAAICTP